jgi:plastocyanin
MPSPARRFLAGPTLAIAIGAAAVCAAAVSAHAADSAELALTIKDHTFDPSQLKVAAGTPIKLTVKNLDATAEEFESKPLQVEKVIAGKASAIIRLKPLAKGSYAFVGEFHEETAKGVLIAE